MYIHIYLYYILHLYIFFNTFFSITFFVLIIGVVGSGVAGSHKKETTRTGPRPLWFQTPANVKVLPFSLVRRDVGVGCEA